MRRLLPATLLVSAAAIGYELLLMRMLSVVQWHHFAWMIISLALLGYGTSGTFIALLRKPLAARFESCFAASALAFGISMIACFALAQRVPFNALEVAWDPRQFLNLGLVYLALFVPFLFAAGCVGLAFTCRGDEIGRIYFFDLLGAGLGAAMTIGLLFLLLPQNALLLLTTLPLAAAALMGARSTARLPLAGVLAGWLTLLLAGIPQQFLELRISEYKGLAQALAVIDSRVIDEVSSPLGYITVVDSPGVPIRHAPGLSFATTHIPPEQLAVFSDADSLSAITRFDGDFGKLAYLGDITAALPYALLDEPRVLVLGAGAGSDVLLALYHGARVVDAVELDPNMTALVADSYADYAGHVYDDPRVTLFAREARGFVASSDRRYELIHIGLLDSFGASGAGVQSLNESYIYTVEALGEYVAHTAPGGFVAITRWIKLPPRDSLKLVATAIETLRRMGVSNPDYRLAVIRGWNTSTLLIKNGVLSGSDIAAIREFTRKRSFDLAWLPGMSAADANRYNVLDEPWLFNGAQALFGEDAADYMARYKFYIEPATDDRPYFFHFFKWRTLPEIYALREVGGAGLIEWGYLVLVATLGQAALAALVLILLPLSRAQRDWPAGICPRFGAYFLLLGFAFLFVEIAFIQKFILFLSHPLYSVAVVLAGFLVFAGLGSAIAETFAGRLAARGYSGISAAVASIALVTVLYLFLLPAVFERAIAYPDAVRIAISILLIAPLAVFMGMPFPLGLTRLARIAPAFVPWAWGINGFASVLSAVMATLLAIQFGFTAVIAVALLLYVFAATLLAVGGTVTPITREK